MGASTLPNVVIGYREYDWVKEVPALVRRCEADGVPLLAFAFDNEGHEEVLRKALRQGNLSLPAAMCQFETFELSTGNPLKVGFVPSPPDTLGMIEDLFLDQILESEIGPCIQSLFDCYGPELRKDRAKKFVRTYIARYNGYNTSLGTALRDGHLDTKGLQFNHLRDFLEAVKIN